MHALWMLVASLAFAGMGACIKLSAAAHSTAEIVFFRSFVGWVWLQAFVAWRQLDLRTPHLRPHTWRAAIGLVAMATYFSAVAMLPLATAITLQYTAPLFMALVLRIWFKEPISRRAAVLMGLGFAGIVLLLHPTLERDEWLGASLGLAAGVLAAFALLNVRRLGQLGEPEWRTVYYFSGYGSLVGLAWTLAAGGFHPPDTRGIALLVGVGTFGTVGQMAMTTAFRRGRTLLAANLSYTTVVFGSLLGAGLWGEALPRSSWAGVALIVGGGMAMTALSRNAPADPD